MGNGIDYESSRLFIYAILIGYLPISTVVLKHSNIRQI